MSPHVLFVIGYADTDEQRGWQDLLPRCLRDVTVTASVHVVLRHVTFPPHSRTLVVLVETSSAGDSFVSKPIVDQSLYLHLVPEHTIPLPEGLTQKMLPVREKPHGVETAAVKDDIGCLPLLDLLLENLEKLKPSLEVEQEKKSRSPSGNDRNGPIRGCRNAVTQLQGYKRSLAMPGATRSLTLDALTAPCLERALGSSWRIRGGARTPGRQMAQFPGLVCAQDRCDSVPAAAWADSANHVYHQRAGARARAAEGEADDSYVGNEHALASYRRVGETSQNKKAQSGGTYQQNPGQIRRAGATGPG